ncbi:MerR family transcriptional regulator [Clostridium zeae]|uniref:MerR family transcriptional regulator n=1 Tax=Clostridium zeae TaxID=2759022 RepID=A0ABQ1ED98_9CLOT|nr:MerR family transcriptional regulator [Clostridium zeae]GFZ32726.1 MerR family transcriptional regulator [Clostridium zeae]
MNTGNVSKLLDISIKTLRLYEDYGIVVAKRDSNDYRNYNEEDINKLKQAKLLRDLGVPLKNVKYILEEKFLDNKVVRELNVQYKVVEKRLGELESIKNTLLTSINDALVSEEDNSNIYFNNINRCLDNNLKNRKTWIDKWGFDRWAESYDKSVKDILDDKLNLFEKYEYVLEIIAKKIEEQRVSKILDIGCGTCNLYNKLNKNIDYTGMDQSIEMLLKAKEKFPNLKLRLGNFLDRPFEENEFEVITSTYAFHHLNDLEKEIAINYMLKYLKANGKIIIGDLMFENYSERIKKRDSLIQAGRPDLWEEIEDEYYSDIQKLKKYSEILGCKVKYQHIVNLTWIVEIIKLEDDFL